MAKFKIKKDEFRAVTQEKTWAMIEEELGLTYDLNNEIELDEAKPLKGLKMNAREVLNLLMKQAKGSKKDLKAELQKIKTAKDTKVPEPKKVKK